MRSCAAPISVPGFGGERHVEADEIGFAQQPFGADEFEPEFLFDGLGGATGVVVEDPHGETGGPACHGLADAAHAEDAERVVVHVLADQQVDPPFRPLAGVHEALALTQPAGRGQQKREGEVGGGVGQDVRRVGDQDAGARGGGNVDVVEADGDVGDDLNAFERGDHRGGELVGQLAHHSLLAADTPGQLFGA